MAQLSTTRSHDHRQTAFHFFTSNILGGFTRSSWPLDDADADAVTLLGDDDDDDDDLWSLLDTDESIFTSESSSLGSSKEDMMMIEER
jgi:hypothetical protein